MDTAAADRQSGIEARYANYFKVGHNATEFLLQFGQFHPDSSLLWFSRIIIGPVFLKELKRMVDESMVAYEQQYGEIRLPGDDAPDSGRNPAKDGKE
jgi:Protein of unknown function (DUF3467)